jgi:hypothetical protein
MMVQVAEGVPGVGLAARVAGGRVQGERAQAEGERLLEAVHPHEEAAARQVGGRAAGVVAGLPVEHERTGQVVARLVVPVCPYCATLRCGNTRS